MGRVGASDAEAAESLKLQKAGFTHLLPATECCGLQGQVPHFSLLFGFLGHAMCILWLGYLEAEVFFGEKSLFSL